MNLDQIRSQIRPIVHIVGVALVAVAALKLFGVNINFGGGVEESALVGIGLLHV